MQRPARFVLIDDEVYCNKISKIFLGKMYPSTEIIDFLSPLEALEYLNISDKNHLVATVILLDINMPELNGWEVLEKLQELPVSFRECLSVYMLSSSIDPKDKQKAAGQPLIKGYIEKPLSREILLKVFGE